MPLMLYKWEGSHFWVSPCVFFSFVSSSPCVFWLRPVLSTNTGYSPWLFGTLRITLIISEILTNIYLSFGEIWNVSFHQFLLICLKFILQEVVTRSKWKRHAFFWDFRFPNIVPLMNGWTLLWTKNNMFQFFCNVNNRRVHCAWLKIAHLFSIGNSVHNLDLGFPN